MDLEHIALITNIKKEINNLPSMDFYHMCDNHCKTRDFCNSVPHLRVDIRSATWDIGDDDKGWDESELIESRMWDAFQWFCDDIEENEGLEIFTDLNGYRVLLGTDIYNKLEEAYELIDDLKNETDSEYADDIAQELLGVLDDLKEESKKVKKFIKLEDALNEWVKDYPKYWEEEQKELKEMEAIEC
jgi:hypothetical protein